MDQWTKRGEWTYVNETSQNGTKLHGAERSGVERNGVEWTERAMRLVSKRRLPCQIGLGHGIYRRAQHQAGSHGGPHLHGIGEHPARCGGLLGRLAFAVVGVWKRGTDAEGPPRCFHSPPRSFLSAPSRKKPCVLSSLVCLNLNLV